MVARPHILLIQADQMAAACLPFHGHPVVQAPHLAALAACGTVFESAYCNVPLCAPSRFSMMAGRLASTIDAFDNACEFPASIPTFAHLLRGAGYRTALSGKMHFVGPDQFHGFEERLTTDIYPADFLWTPDWRLGVDQRFIDLTPVRESGLCKRSVQIDYDEEVVFEAERLIFDHARSSDDRPLFLTVSFTHPHDPYIARKRAWDRYDPADIDLPRVPFIEIDARDPHSRDISIHHGMDLYRPTEEDLRRTRHAYYANITMVDEWVGRLLGALDDCGMAGTTAIVFTADHGEMLGERGQWYKKTFFEPAARVPLVIAEPGGTPRRVTGPVSLLDLMPSLAEIGGASLDPLPDGVDGDSLMPVVRGAPAVPDRTIASELMSEGTAGPIVMLRRDRWKYIASSAYPARLYDLANDPDELVNRAGDAAVEEVEASLAAEVAEGWDFDVLTRRILTSQQRRLAIRGPLAEGIVAAWDFQPVKDASAVYYRGKSARSGLRTGDVA
ncbi:MAG: choline-sulfatase [Rhodospirillales bacterium]|nr:choline-sulfatase [Rhodospirillales bacterium]